MSLNHLPSHGWRVTYQIELRGYSSMEASLTADMYTAKGSYLFFTLNSFLCVLRMVHHPKALCANIEFNQYQIDDLRKENTVLKGTVGLFKYCRRRGLLLFY